MFILRRQHFRTVSDFENLSLNYRHAVSIYQGYIVSLFPYLPISSIQPFLSTDHVQFDKNFINFTYNVMIGCGLGSFGFGFYYVVNAIKEDIRASVWCVCCHLAYICWV